MNLLLNSLTHIAAVCDKTFFGLPTWYKYLDVGAKKVGGETYQCQVKDFTVPNDIFLVGLALIDMLLYLAGIVAVMFVIYGGIRYVTSQGEPDATAKARTTITDALIGLLFAVTAIAFVTFLGSRLGN